MGQTSAVPRDISDAAVRDASETEGERRPFDPFLCEACSVDEGLELPRTRRLTRAACFWLVGRCGDGDGRGAAIVVSVGASRSTKQTAVVLGLRVVGGG